MPGGGPRVELRDMTQADLADGLRLSRASGWNQTLEDWRLLLSLGPGLFRVATEDARVVGSGGAVRYGDALSWICMILVDPARRGRGIGAWLFDDVLARVRATRCVGLDATPEGRSVYLRRGFADGPRLVRMGAGTATAADAPGSVRPLAPGDMESVLAEDRRVFGADRGTPLAWARERAPKLAWIARRADTTAYCFGRRGDRFDHAGPVVAGDPELGRDLLAACLSRPRQRPLIVDARADPAWLGALAGLGFEQQRSFTRMYLGDTRPAADPARELGIFGPELG